jgi:hypothetical protein
MVVVDDQADGANGVGVGDGDVPPKPWAERTPASPMGA